jgi:HK97 family phage major capsid protein
MTPEEASVTLTAVDLSALRRLAAAGDRRAKEALDEHERARRRPALYDGPAEDGEPWNGPGWGEQYIDSGDFSGLQHFAAAIVAGGAPRDLRSPGCRITGGLRSLITSLTAPTSPHQWAGVLETGLYRPVRLLQLLSVVPATADVIDYVEEDTISDQAAPVEEASALTGTSGTKPESHLHFTPRQVNVDTFAAWLPATKRAIANGGELRALIDGGLTADVQTSIEDAVMNGTGVPGFNGILDVVTNSVGPPAGGQTALHLIRKARTKIETAGRTNATAVALNPNDAEDIDLLQDDQHRFLADPFSPAGQPTWGITRVVTDAVPEGTAIVGDWRRAVLFDREAVTISVGTINDQFTRNMFTILAEAVAGFAVIRPTAFCTVDLAA